MFKARKRNVKQKGALRRKKDDEEEEENSTQKAQKEEEGTAATIARVKKKRKLLTELQYKKGTDAALLLKGRDDSAIDSSAVDTSVVDQPDGSQEGVMEQKHKQALEQYVESKLVGMVGGDNNNNKPTSMTNNNQDDSTTSNPNNNNNNKLTKEELYRQIAQTSENMVGRSSSTNQGDSKKDGDVGTGGAMLVAGTGLAEVILPVDERIKAVHATQEAAAVGPRKHAHHNNSNKSYGNMPKSQVPVLPAGAARFQVSAADRHRHFPSNNNQRNNNNTASVPTTATTESVPEGDDDPGRVGFDAARGKAVTSQTQNNNNHNNGQHSGRSNNNNNHKNRSSDDKVYGNFLKHHRENQWRGR